MSFLILGLFTGAFRDIDDRLQQSFTDKFRNVVGGLRSCVGCALSWAAPYDVFAISVILSSVV